MREIKFRVWDSENMHYNVRVGGFPETVPTVYQHDEWVHLQPMEGITAEMQYTGLKDKNGKEIYEGDIVEIGRTRKHIYPVIFIDGVFGIKPKGYGEISLYSYCNEISGTAVKIIGNLYENPELLK